MNAWRNSPERAKVWAEDGGCLTLKMESVFLNPVDFSPIR